MQTPWLGLFGDLDKGIPVERRRGRCAARSATPRLRPRSIRYADAEHGFHCDARDAYHEASATDAWQRALEWFDTHLG